LRAMVLFGWPLLINGLLMFGIQQGDRTIVGAFFTMEELGWFSAAFTLTLFPGIIAAKVTQTFFLPVLSRICADTEEFRDVAYSVIQFSLFLGVAITLALILFGPLILTTLYGQKYIAALLILPYLSLLQCARLTKVGPILVAISKGDTRNPLVANFARTFFIAVALCVVIMGWGIEELIYCGILGEIAALIVSLVRLHSRRQIELFPIIGAVVFSLGFPLLVLSIMKYTNIILTQPDSMLITLPLFIILTVISILFMPNLKRKIMFYMNKC
jgi:O-antigen/teichoic acid export membrane protein